MQDLAALVASECNVETAMVVAPPVPGVVPQVATITFTAGNRGGQARVAYIGAGALAGVLTPLLPGTEVLVLVPKGDPNKAVILGAMHSVVSPIPPTWTALNTRIQNPAGVELRSAEGLPADGVVLGAFLVALQSYVTAMDSFLTVVANSDMSPAVAAAATLAKAGTASFIAALATSAAVIDPDSGGVGGAPYASTLVRATQ